MAAKTPQDHKAKQTTKDGVREIVIDGIMLHIDPDVFDDVDLMDEIYDLQTEGGFSTPVMRKVFGDEYQSVKDGLRDPATGRVTGEKLEGFMNKLMAELAPNS